MNLKIKVIVFIIMAPLQSCIVRFSNVGQENVVFESIHLHEGNPTVIVGAPNSSEAGKPNFVAMVQVLNGDFTFHLNLIYGMYVSTLHVAHCIDTYGETGRPIEHVRVQRQGRPIFVPVTVGNRVMLTDSTDARVFCRFVYTTNDPTESGVGSDSEDENAATWPEGEVITGREAFDRQMRNYERRIEWLYESLNDQREAEMEVHHVRMAAMNDVVVVSSGEDTDSDDVIYVDSDEDDAEVLI